MMRPYKPLLLFFLALFLSQALNAQKQILMEDVKLLNTLATHQLDIEFKAEKEIYNLLVVISDSRGNTIFLDNQFRFKGNYKKRVDLANLAKGTYSLKISRDKNKLSQNIPVE